MKHKPTEFVLSFQRRLYRELLQSILVLFPFTYMQHIQFSCVSGQLIALKLYQKNQRVLVLKMFFNFTKKWDSLYTSILTLPKQSKKI